MNFMHTDPMIEKPTLRPNQPFFGSGPTAKRPGWTPAILKNAPLGRSHRSKIGLEKIRSVIDLTRKLLDIPLDYKIALLPGGATTAMEAAMWSLLGPRPVDVFSWDVFGNHWLTAVRDQLHLEYRSFTNPQDFNKADFDNDIVVVWNGSTSGICLNYEVEIPENRKGLVLCDATSAVFAVPLPWEKLDAVSFSWQKGLGGEGAHGILILSPRALDRLSSYIPTWPMPRGYQLAKNGVVLENIFKGMTVNTPSLMCVEDMIDALLWAENLGRDSVLYARTLENYNTIAKWIDQNTWVRFRVEEPLYRSPVTVCLEPTDDAYHALSIEDKHAFVKDICDQLNQEGVGFDIKGHIHDAPCFRIWCGPTVETQDIQNMLPWLTWSYWLRNES